MDLVYQNVYGENGKATALTLAKLYTHLEERPPEACISHQIMPAWEQHEAFVQSQPYAAWWLVYRKEPGFADEVCIGNAYVTRAREIGITIDEAHRRQHSASVIIQKIMEMHQPRGPFWANVAPDNKASHALFASLGFRLVQLTYRHDPVFFDEPLYPGHPAARLIGNPAIKLPDESGAEAPDSEAEAKEGETPARED
jgi:RimJ/RimL family protein N-acetyltransferase